MFIDNSTDLIQEIIINNPILNQFEHIFEKSKFQGSWLIINHELTLKNIVVQYLINKITDQTNHNFSVLNLENNLNPNLIIIQNQISKEITIEDVRKLGKFFSLKSATSKYRIAVINGVEQLNSNSLNALLKIVEEPPKYCIIFLLANSPDMSATLKSRCMMIRLKQLSSDLAVKLISVVNDQISHSDIKNLLIITNNSINMALELARIGGISLYEQLINLFIIDKYVDPINLQQLINQLKQSKFYWSLFVSLIDYLLIFIIKYYANVKTELITINEELLQNFIIKKYDKLDQALIIWREIQLIILANQPAELDINQLSLIVTNKIKIMIN